MPHPAPLAPSPILMRLGFGVCRWGRGSCRRRRYSSRPTWTIRFPSVTITPSGSYPVCHVAALQHLNIGDGDVNWDEFFGDLADISLGFGLDAGADRKLLGSRVP